MSTRITVTQTDIDEGEKGGCNTCPIAIAASRAFPNWFPAVSCYNLYLDSAPGLADGPAAPLPQEASQFIVAFDKGHKVEPFSFEVSINA